MARRKNSGAAYGDHDARRAPQGKPLESSYTDYRHPGHGERGYELGESENPQAYRPGHQEEGGGHQQVEGRVLDLGSEHYSEETDEDFPSKLLEDPEPTHSRGESDWSGGPSPSGEFDGPAISEEGREGDVR